MPCRRQETQISTHSLLVCSYPILPPPARLTSSRLRRSWLSSVLVLLSWVSRSRILFWAARSLEAACSLVCSTCPKGTEVGLAYLAWGTPGKEKAGPLPLTGLAADNSLEPQGRSKLWGQLLQPRFTCPLPTLHESSPKTWYTCLRPTQAAIKGAVVKKVPSPLQ